MPEGHPRSWVQPCAGVVRSAVLQGARHAQHRGPHLIAGRLWRRAEEPRNATHLRKSPVRGRCPLEYACQMGRGYARGVACLDLLSTCSAHAYPQIGLIAQRFQRGAPVLVRRGEEAVDALFNYLAVGAHWRSDDRTRTSHVLDQLVAALPCPLRPV